MSKKFFSKKPNQKMTAQEAVTFQKFSASNAATIEEAIAERAGRGLYPSCKCKPYSDVFTFDRWKAQGYFVRKGEKSLCFVPTIREYPDKDGQGNEVVKKSVWRSYVFCRCQVNASEKAAPVALDSSSVILAEAAPVQAETQVEVAEPLGVSDDRFASLEF